MHARRKIDSNQAKKDRGKQGQKKPLKPLSIKGRSVRTNISRRNVRARTRDTKTEPKEPTLKSGLLNRFHKALCTRDLHHGPKRGPRTGLQNGLSEQTKVK
jgi:hypothetical protein